MNNIEFYIFEDELWAMFPNGNNERITENNTDLVKELLSTIIEQYPEAYSALQECYKNSSMNIPYYQFLIVNRFCKCNFGNLDNTNSDIKSNGGFSFERVPCPLRGECKYEGVICGARFNSKLSNAELRVMELVYKGFDNSEIADNLYLSPHTVKNHIKSVYQKLGIHEKSEFIRYANDNNIFNCKD